MSQDARFDEEQSTARRARILGLNYTDVSQIKEKILYKNFLSVPDLLNLRVAPLSVSEHHIALGITTSTSQQTMQALRQRFPDQKIGCLYYL